MTENLQKNEMADDLLLSIIIPVYNVQDYLPRCLDSCTVQQMKISKYKYEVICVDDGSTDNSLNIIKEYASKYDLIKVISKNNNGVSSARNCGISEAKGKYIWFVDSDDWIAEGSVCAIADMLESQSEYPDCVLFLFRQVAEYENKIIDIINDAKLVQGAYETTKNSYSNSVCCRWFKKEILTENGFLFDEDMKYAEDTLFLSNIKLKCKNVLIIEDICYYYFKRQTSSMHKIDAASHAYSMLRLAIEYKKNQQNLSDSQIKDRMAFAYTRAMQAFCRDLCLYCNDKNSVLEILEILKDRKLYPFGIDWSNFRIDRKQSLKNDILNWMFALMSIEPIFWVQWFLCGKLFKKMRQNQKFDVSVFAALLTNSVDSV